jgi:hypothetical protein
MGATQQGSVDRNIIGMSIESTMTSTLYVLSLSCAAESIVNEGRTGTWILIIIFFPTVCSPIMDLS